MHLAYYHTKRYINRNIVDTLLLPSNDTPSFHDSRRHGGYARKLSSITNSQTLQVYSLPETVNNLHLTFKCNSFLLYEFNCKFIYSTISKMETVHLEENVLLRCFGKVLQATHNYVRNGGVKFHTICVCNRNAVV